MLSPALPLPLLGLVLASLLGAPAAHARDLDKWRKPWSPPLPLASSASSSSSSNAVLDSLAVNAAVASYDAIPDVLPDCLPNTVSAVEMNALIEAKGAGFVLSLCPSQTYELETTLILTAAGQEISTLGYPTDDTRAMLIVSGSTDLENGMSTGIYGACAACSDIKIRNVQINGSRVGLDPINNGGLIEIGGQVSGQLVEHVRSFDPRGWTCLHIAEGSLDCQNATIRYNDIGPCGHDAPYGSWADGISNACTQSSIEGNTIVDPTDGGIVVFGALGSTIRNNTIMVQNSTALGGINLVDYSPWDGFYNSTVVENNTIIGGLATSYGDDQHGPSSTGVIIKIGIGMGPRVWFGAGSAELQMATGGTVRDNAFTGAFGWAMAAANVQEFTVTGNVLVGNTSFIGERSVNCTGGVEEQGPITLGVAFVVQTNTTFSSTLQGDFESGNVIFNTCLSPPPGTDFSWPYGDWPGSIDYAPSSAVDWTGGASSDASPSSAAAASSSSAAAASATAAASGDGSSAALPALRPFGSAYVGGSLVLAALGAALVL